jgi:hypothetical protein
VPTDFKSVLLNVSFGFCTRQVVDDAEAEYLAFFAGKAVAMIRAPDVYVYPAPFNLVEIFFVAPLELVHQLPLTQSVDECMRRSFLSPSTYAKVQSCTGFHNRV